MKNMGWHCTASQKNMNIYIKPNIGATICSSMIRKERNNCLFVYIRMEIDYCLTQNDAVWMPNVISLDDGKR